MPRSSEWSPPCKQPYTGQVKIEIKPDNFKCKHLNTKFDHINWPVSEVKFTGRWAERGPHRVLIL